MNNCIIDFGKRIILKIYIYINRFCVNNDNITYIDIEDFDSDMSDF